jgi:hypothetical protein
MTQHRDPVQFYDVFVGYRRVHRGLALECAAEIMRLDPWEVSSFIQEGGRCDTIDAKGRYLVAVETGDKPSNHPTP